MAPPKKNFRCEICDKTFKSKQKLQSHEKSKIHAHRAEIQYGSENSDGTDMNDEAGATTPDEEPSTVELEVIPPSPPQSKERTKGKRPASDSHDVPSTYGSQKCKNKVPRLKYPIPVNSEMPAQDPEDPADLADTEYRDWLLLSEDPVAEQYRDHWNEIRTSYLIRRNELANEFTLRLNDDDQILNRAVSFIRRVHAIQRSSYRLNVRFGYLFRNRETGELRFFYQSCNTRLFHDGDRLITNQEDFDNALAIFESIDPFGSDRVELDTKWRLHRIPNVTVITSTIHQLPLRGIVTLPGYLMRRRSLFALVNNTSGQPYNDPYCLFRCIVAAERKTTKGIEADVLVYLKQWCDHTGIEPPDYLGCSVSDLDEVEKCFDIMIHLYECRPMNTSNRMSDPIDGAEAHTNDVEIAISEHPEETNDCRDYVDFDGEDDEENQALEDLLISQEEEEQNAADNCDLVATLIRRPKATSGRLHLYLNIHKSHLSLIKSLETLCKAFNCIKCSGVFKTHFNYTRHIQSCKGVRIDRIFPGSGYNYTRTVFEEMALEGIEVGEQRRYYPFVASFDLENYHVEPNKPRQKLTMCSTETAPYVLLSQLPAEDEHYPPASTSTDITAKFWTDLRTAYSRTQPIYTWRTNRNKLSNAVDLINYVRLAASSLKSPFRILFQYYEERNQELSLKRMFATTEFVACQDELDIALSKLKEKIDETESTTDVLAFRVRFAQRKQFIASNSVLASCAIATNTPGYQEEDDATKPKAIFLLSAGSEDSLVKEIVKTLLGIAETAAAVMTESFREELQQLKEMHSENEAEAKQLQRLYPELRLPRFGKATVAAGRRRHNWALVPWDAQNRFVHFNSKARRLKNLHDRLTRWLTQLRIIGYNSSRFDINLMRKFFFPELIRADRVNRRSQINVIKKANGYLSITTPNFRLIDVCNYVAPGTSLDQFLTCFGEKGQKGIFPHEWWTSLELLQQDSLPPYECFFNKLRNTICTQAAYQELLDIWRDNNMHTMKDYLQWYNCQDVVPLIRAATRMQSYWRERKIDCWSDAVSLPGLALNDLMRTRPPHVNFPLEDEQTSFIFELARANLVGGPSIVYSRLAERDVTPISSDPNSETVGHVLGYDAISLYLSSTMSPMPINLPRIWELDESTNLLNAREAYPYARLELEFVEWKMKSTPGLNLLHRWNDKQQPRVGQFRLDALDPVQRRGYEFLGCWWHGCDCPLANRRTDAERLALQARTAERRQIIESLNYTLETTWECEFLHEKATNPALQQFLETYFNLPHYSQSTIGEAALLSSVQKGDWFGLLLIDAHVPDDLIEQFDFFPPFYKNANLDVSQLRGLMKQFALRENLLKRPTRMLVSSLFAERQLFISPYVKWMLDHKIVVTRVYLAIQYKPYACFRDMGLEIAECRRQSDADPVNKKQLGDTAKLKGNSLYGKSITNQEKHVDTVLCDEWTARELVKNAHFSSMDPIDDEEKFYECSLKKKRIRHNLPHLIGTFVYGYSKIRLLAFVHDFLDRFIDRRHWRILETDTDSVYFAVSFPYGTDIDKMIKPGLELEYAAVKHTFLPTDQRAKRQPGLFQVEWTGYGMICLNSKTYTCWGPNCNKCSSKGIVKSQNDLNANVFRSVLETQRSHEGKVRTIRRMGKSVATVELHRSGLTFFYAKREVLDDGTFTRTYRHI